MAVTKWNKPKYVLEGDNRYLLEERDGYNLHDMTGPDGPLFDENATQTWIPVTQLEKFLDKSKGLQAALAAAHKDKYRGLAEVRAEVMGVFENDLLCYIIKKFDDVADDVTRYVTAKHAARAANREYFAEMEKDRQEMAAARQSRNSGRQSFKA